MDFVRQPLKNNTCFLNKVFSVRVATSTKYTSSDLAVAPLRTEGFRPPPRRLDSRPNPAWECAQLHSPTRFRRRKDQSIPAPPPGRRECANRRPCNSSILWHQ